ncbi:selenide, water dikinase SelD [bacterium]|nr:selenide, water dikinase SelD [bacterium]
MSDPSAEPRLTSLAHGGGCGCKLSSGVLDEILGKNGLGVAPPELLVDAATRDDAAVYRLTDEIALVATTDFFTPIVDDPFDFGRIAATNALSDVYAMGGRPILSLAIAGMPLGRLSSATMAAILEGGRTVAADAGAPVAGGHSIDSAEPIYGLVALGVVHPKRILTNAGARAGDVLILGKPLGVGVFSAALRKGVLSPEDAAVMLASTTLLNRPGLDLASVDGVHALTDVTGFGLLGHLSEVCRASGVSAEIDAAATPVFEGARRLAAEGVVTGASGRNWTSVEPWVEVGSTLESSMCALLTDPQTSGGLLVSCAPEAVDDALACFRRHGHRDAAVIGRIGAGAPRVTVR